MINKKRIQYYLPLDAENGKCLEVEGIVLCVDRNGDLLMDVIDEILFVEVGDIKPNYELGETDYKMGDVVYVEGIIDAQQPKEGCLHTRFPKLKLHERPVHTFTIYRKEP